MTIEDIIAEALASGQSKDFTNWLRFCLQWECAYEEDGVRSGAKTSPAIRVA